VASRSGEKLAIIPLVAAERAEGLVHAPLLVRKDEGDEVVDDACRKGGVTNAREVVERLGNEVARPTLPGIAVEAYAKHVLAVGTRNVPAGRESHEGNDVSAQHALVHQVDDGLCELFLAARSVVKKVLGVGGRAVSETQDLGVANARAGHDRDVDRGEVVVLAVLERLVQLGDLDGILLVEGAGENLLAHIIEDRPHVDGITRAISSLGGGLGLVVVLVRDVGSITGGRVRHGLDVGLLVSLGCVVSLVQEAHDDLTTLEL
jgi:hypothetical protein